MPNIDNFSDDDDRFLAIYTPSWIGMVFACVNYNTKSNYLFCIMSLWDVFDVHHPRIKREMYSVKLKSAVIR